MTSTGQISLNDKGYGASAAVVFDYHLVGVGMRFSDCRNVTGSLGLAARSAFWDEYGQVDPREEIIDRPLAVIHSLVVAAKLPKFPRWATASRELVANGRLLADLRGAISLAEGLT